jgi:hypothetical protein
MPSIRFLSRKKRKWRKERAARMPSLRGGGLGTCTSGVGVAGVGAA